MNPIGGHYSIKKGYLGALKEALLCDADALQIFTKSPASAKYRSVTEEEASEVANWENRNKIKNILVHSSYLINIAGNSFDEESFAIKSIVEDVENAAKLKADGVIVHFGKKLSLSKDTAEENIINNVKLIAEKTKNLKPKIVLENTAGQGTEIGYDLDEFSQIFNKINNFKKVSVCIDTAHAFGAGYDISDTEKSKEIIAILKNNLGLKNISCIHFNDSKKKLGSKVDRHEDIGFGLIGENGLKTFLIELIKKGGHNIPLILETPQENEPYKKQIEKIRSWLV